MKRLPLHIRLALVLLLLLLAVGAVNVASTLVTTRWHLEEANQRANLDLASTIASMKESRLLGPSGDIESSGLEEIFHWMMVVNPAVQFYLLDLQGNVLAYDPTPGPAQLSHVSLSPIHDLLTEPDHLPILGDDPRAPDQPKIFSVAPIPLNGDPAGYLYVILDDPAAASPGGRLESSYVLRLSLWTGLGAVALAIVFGLLLFGRLTRPLRQLTRRMQALQLWSRNPEPGPDRSPDVEITDSPTGDEVTVLTRTFDEMIGQIGRQVQQIERMAALRNELVANVSHDLRTPIAMLQGYLETLAIKDLTPSQRTEYLRIALGQSQRLGKLVGDLFELTKLESDDAEATMEPFVLPELVQDNVHHFQLQAEERGVVLEATFDRDLPTARGDIGLVERALQNLIGNALRFTPSGGRVSVGLRADEAGRLEVRVADTGCGISKSDLPHVFDRSYRCRFTSGDSGTATTSDDKGSGLGLAITQRIARLHGGDIEAMSQLGKGTEFAFTVPAA
ncbi:MAG: HAMP domain-containing histidine kinase [Thermoanaerobaculia bacterium]|nr:HAMP domain-containing histidine kinase [Thermoanaerobaculia bacterium]